MGQAVYSLIKPNLRLIFLGILYLSVSTAGLAENTELRNAEARLRATLSRQSKLVRSLGQDDPRWWFAKTYELVTQGELENLPKMTHPEVVAAMVDKFAYYYDENLKAQSATGRAIDDHWDKALAAIVNHQPNPFASSTMATKAFARLAPQANALLIGAVAHIRYDLWRGVALAVNEFPGLTISDIRPDFERMLPIFQLAQTQVANDFRPTWQRDVFHRFIDGHESFETKAGVRTEEFDMQMERILAIHEAAKARSERLPLDPYEEGILSRALDSFGPLTISGGSSYVPAIVVRILAQLSPEDREVGLSQLTAGSLSNTSQTLRDKLMHLSNIGPVPADSMFPNIDEELDLLKLSNGALAELKRKSTPFAVGSDTTVANQQPTSTGQPPAASDGTKATEPSSPASSSTPLVVPPASTGQPPAASEGTKATGPSVGGERNVSGLEWCVSNWRRRGFVRWTVGSKRWMHMTARPYGSSKQDRES
jgi:hypothetical protein